MAEYKTINEITNVSTQANDDDLLIMWDKNREKTVKIKNKDFNKNNQPKTLETPIEVDNVEETTVEGALGAINDKVKNFTAGVAFKGTRSAYNNAKLIPEGSDGHIPSGALVIITDEGKTYVTNGTGSNQTLELVANATFNGSHAEWNALTLAQKAMYNIVNFTDDEAIGLQISDVVEDGNMNPVTSNGVFNYVNDPHNKASFYYNANTAHSTLTDYKNGLLSALNSFHIPNTASAYVFAVRFKGGYFAFYDVLITGLPGLAKITIADEGSHEGDRFAFSYNGTHWIA